MPFTDEAADSATDATSSASSLPLLLEFVLLSLFAGYRGGGGRPTMSSLGVRKLADANDDDDDDDDGMPSSCCCSKSGIVDGVR
jgi:hypothetical protein